MTQGGVDYGSSSKSLSFDSNNLVQSLYISISNDSILEFDEIFQVDLVSSTNGVRVNPSSVTITILDDDGECNS